MEMSKDGVANNDSYTGDLSNYCESIIDLEIKLWEYCLIYNLIQSIQKAVIAEDNTI
jgi:hypothetical protein